MSEQLKKLATALQRGGIAANEKEAYRKAREILKIPEPEEEVEAVPLDQVTSVNDELDVASDKSLKELLDEDSKNVYK